MKKQKLKNLLKIGILTFGISFLFWNCQKEDDNQIINPDQNKNKSISQTSLNDILNQNSVSKETFGLMTKNQKTSLKNKTNKPTFKLTSSKGVKYINNGNNYHVFLMERTDKSDSYYYNLVVHEHNGTLEKYIYTYPLDKTENVTVSKIGNASFSKESKAVSAKTSGDCMTYHVYNVTPCPCVGHTDPLICQCPIQPIWTYSHSYQQCTNPNPTNPDIEEPDNDNDPDIGDGININSGFDPNTGCYRSGGCYPDDSPEPEPFDPGVPLPSLEPDFDSDNENSILIDQLELTNLQKDWLEKLENTNFKTQIENYLIQFVFTDQFNDAKVFAKSAVDFIISETDELKELNSQMLNLNFFQDTKITYDTLLKNFENIKNSHFDSVTDKPLFSNYCAINLSHALLKSGVTINSSKVTKCWGCIDKNYKNGHAIRAEELANWLLISKINGLNKVKKLNGENFKDYVSGKKGIIFFKDYWQRDSDSGTNRTGDHIDIWTGNGLASENFFSDWFRLTFPDFTESVFGTSSLFKSKDVFFWELN